MSRLSAKSLGVLHPASVCTGRSMLSTRARKSAGACASGSPALFLRVEGRLQPAASSTTGLEETLANFLQKHFRHDAGQG